jgi:hypothetical protein
MWTQFWDMNSGGGQKEKWAQIYIEAPEDEAIVIFYNRFGHNPNRVTCTCCGEDYSISEYDTLEHATAFHRGCLYDDKIKEYVESPDTRYGTHEYKTLAEFLESEEGLAIYDKDILPEERVGDVPEQGYVWQD